MTELVRTDEYIIHSYETDFVRRVRISALNRYMQESAWQHAESLGAGFASLRSKNCAWVLTRAVVRLESFPTWGESLILSTWPSGIDHFFAYRDFQFTDKAGCELGRATTSWCVIDLSERSPQPVAKIFPFRMPKNKELMFPERPPKIEIPNATDFTWHTKAGYQDLDTNEHVNNTRYIDWFYETLPLDFLRNHQLSQIEINYLAEAFYDQRIVVATQKVADNIFLHTVNELSSASSICRARSVWR